MRLIYFILFIVIGVSCQAIEVQDKDVLNSLVEADKKENTKEVINLFTEDVIILYPDSPPFIGKETAGQLYELIWNRNNTQTINYRPDSTKTNNNSRLIHGMYFFYENNKTDSISFFSQHRYGLQQNL